MPLIIVMMIECKASFSPEKDNRDSPSRLPIRLLPDPDDPRMQRSVLRRTPPSLSRPGHGGGGRAEGTHGDLPRGGEHDRGARDDVARRTGREVPREERRGDPPPLPPGGRRS